MKHAEAQRAPLATTVAILLNLTTSASFAPSRRLPPGEPRRIPETRRPASFADFNACLYAVSIAFDDLADDRHHNLPVLGQYALDRRGISRNLRANDNASARPPADARTAVTLSTLPLSHTALNRKSTAMNSSTEHFRHRCDKPRNMLAQADKAFETRNTLPVLILKQNLIRTAGGIRMDGYSQDRP